MEIQELVRLLRTEASDRTVSEALALNRRTVAKYRGWAAREGLLAPEPGPLPAAGELERRLRAAFPSVPPPQQTSSVAAYQQEIADLRARGLEVAAIRQRLEERHQQPVSYSAVWRLVRRLAAAAAATAGGPRDVFVRVEVAPGAEAQVDFGDAGLALDPTSGQARKSWVFVLVLSWSRHTYAELVFDQRVETWLLCHRHAFEFFGGVPARVVPDNLKAAIVRASLHEPQAQRAYRECATHYGFLIDPNPPRSPHLKGKVEQGGVHYVKRNFLAGRELEPLDVRNAKLRTWCTEIAGQRVHGTTQERPLSRFRQVEQVALLPLPATPYDVAVWGQARVYRDCHLTFQRAYYSAPFRLVGQDLWVRAGTRTVELYTGDHALVATHDRATAPGQRQTLLAHLPPEKVPGLILTREDCRAQAQAVGPATAMVVARLLDHRPEDRLRPAGRLLRLATRFSAARLEQACARALAYGSLGADGEGAYPSVKRILHAGWDQTPVDAPAAPTAGSAAWRGAHPAGVPRPPGAPPLTTAPSPPPRRFAFVRQASEFVANLFGTPVVSGAGTLETSPGALPTVGTVSTVGGAP